MAFWQAQAVYSPKGNGGANYGKCHHLSNTVIDILLHPAHIAWSCMHPILFSPDQSNHLISEETNGTDLKQWEKIQALHSLPTTWSPIFQLSDTMLQVNQSSYGQCCRPPWTQHGAEHMHGWKRWIPNWQPTILHWYSPQQPAYYVSPMPCETIGKAPSWKTGRLQGSSLMTREASPTHATTFQGTLAEQNSKLWHMTMGAYASMLLKFPTMAINDEAQLYRDGGWIPTSLDYAISSLGNSKATDLHMGWAFEQFHALDHMQPWSWYKATTDSSCHVESLERVQFATVMEMHWNFTSSIEVQIPWNSPIHGNCVSNDGHFLGKYWDWTLLTINLSGLKINILVAILR